jgi:effector-binding domain-containing protein
VTIRWSSSRCDGGGDAAYRSTVSVDTPRVATIVPQPTIAIRRVIPMPELDLGEVFGAAFPRLFAALGERGMPPAGPPFGRYHEWGERVDVEIGVPVATRVPGLPSAAVEGELFASELPGGPAAMITHVGPYHGLSAANAELAAWIEAQGLTRSSGLWESYRDDPGSTPHTELRTDIVQPVEQPTG